jgi:hypothetical protein
MKSLRVIDEIGNRQDIDTDYVPRIGERIILVYGTGGEPVKEHYLRVKDVTYRLDNKRDNQAAILVMKDSSEPWPAN